MADLGTVQPYTFTLCKSTGENIEEIRKVQNRSIIEQLNVPTAVKFDFDIYASSYAYALLESQPRVKVWRPSTAAELAIDPVTVRQLVFYGTLPSDGSSEDANARWASLQFQDPMWVLNDRYMDTSITYAATDQGDILWGILALENAKTNGETYIRKGVTNTGTVRDRTYDPGKNVSGLISDMTQVIDGCDVNFIPVDNYQLSGSNIMGTFNAYKQRGQDRPEAKFLYVSQDDTGSGLKTNVGNMVRTRAKVFTKATFVGAGGISEVYQNATSPYGLSEDYETVSDVSIPQTLLDKAVGVVGNRQNAPMVIEVRDPTPEAPQPYVDYDIGDTVYCTCRAGFMEFYDLPMRVMGIQIDIDQQGNIKVTLTLATVATNNIAVTLPPPPTGTSPGADAPPPGNETVSIPHTAVHGSVAISSEPQYNGELTKVFTPNANPAWIYGATVSGLVVGERYTISCEARGPDLATAGTAFKLHAGGDSGLNGSTFGADISAQIFSATLVTRQTWQNPSVTFTATATTAQCGWYVEQSDLGSGHVTYTSHWEIVPSA